MKKTLILFAFCLSASLMSGKTSNSNTSCSKKNVTDVTLQTSSPSASTAPNDFAYRKIKIKKYASRNRNVCIEFEVDLPTVCSYNVKKAIMKHVTKFFNINGNYALSVAGLGQLVQAKANHIGNDPDNEPGYIYSENSSISIKNYNKYINLSLSYYGEASGMMHGMSSCMTYTIVKATGETLTFNDIIAPQNQNRMLSIIEEELIKQYYDANDSEPGFVEISMPTSTPEITDKGLDIYYDPGEIDCYAAGSPCCTIPYSRIAHLMTAKAKALLR